MALNVKQYEQSPIRIATETFIQDTDSLREGLPIAMIAIQGSHRASHKTFDTFVASKCKKMVKQGKTVIKVPFELVTHFEGLRRELSKSLSVYGMVERSFLVSLVSQYDAFLGRLVRALITFKPHALNISNEKSDVDYESKQEKALTYTDLLKFGSIEEAKEHVISEAIDNLLRKSHKDQFLWLEKRFDINLRTDLPSWPDFVEITQRRHLFVHSDGIVSRQYLKKCSEDGVKLKSEVKVGACLDMDQEYFEHSRKILYEIGFKLSQVLWRKVVPSQIEWADTYLNNTAYQLIASGEYDLAKTLLNFACKTLKKHQDEKTERMLTVNRALAYKLSGSVETATAIIEEHDWTATGDLFALAIAALRDDIPKVTEVMKRLGKNNPEIDVCSYREWPLFFTLRANSDFQMAFRKVFREPLVPANIDFEPQIEPSGSSGVHDEKVNRGPGKRVSRKPTVH